MGIKDRSKWLFADCLEDMLRSMAFGDIYVSEICARCETNRQNFYYHFHDKYDLAAWLFLRDVDICSCKMCCSVQDMLVMSLRRAEKRRAIYAKITDDFGRTQVTDYIHRYNVDNCIRILKNYYNTTAVSREVQFTVEFYSYGMVCTTFDWLSGRIDMTADELGACQYQMMPDFLREAYSREETVQFV